MTVRLSHWRSPLKRAMLTAIVAALVPLPLCASSGAGSTPGSAPATPQTLKTAVRAAAVSNAAVVAAPRAKASRKDQSGSTKHSTGFFRTGAGAAALAVMAVGTGYALYSVSHDRIKSPGAK